MRRTYRKKRCGYARRFKRRFGARRGAKRSRYTRRGRSAYQIATRVNLGGKRMYPLQTKYACYNPPMGRMSSVGGNIAKCKMSCVLTSRWTVGSAKSGTLNFQSQVSNFTIAGASLPTSVPLCPDFYRCVDNWRSITFTGLKLEVFTQPTFDLVPGAVIGMGCYGRAWSVVDYTPYAITNLSGDRASRTYANYGNIELASTDPTFKPEKFMFGQDTTKVAVPRRMFKRFVTIPSINSKAGGDTVFTNVGSGTTLPAFASSAVAGNSNQLDVFIIYNIAEFLTSANSGCNFMQKETLYFTCYFRNPPQPSEYPTIFAPINEVTTALL